MRAGTKPRKGGLVWTAVQFGVVGVVGRGAESRGGVAGAGGGEVGVCSGTAFLGVVGAMSVGSHGETLHWQLVGGVVGVGMD